MIDLVKTGPDGSNRETASRLCGTADRGTSVHDRPTSDTPSIPPEPRPSHVPTREASSRGRPIRVHDHKPRTTHRASRRQRLTTVGTTRVTHTITPSDQEGLVPRPAKPSTNIIRPADPTNERKSLGHDRPDRADSRSHPIAGRTSRPTVRTVRSTRSRF
ncbi:unnamed protein product [Microthlaspi erraticum]|uniref:Uncharacterized protein n=1 Tax=Microthlaspi erraticum TaxID=1685480 RepID=A0A6D2I144_9BRAS|nr:unnamed protein product [Microthlaspi erraticum]